MKTCRKCQASKGLSEFSLSRRTPDGRHAWCKECFAVYYAENRAAYAERNRKWRDRNRERHAENHRRWREANKERVLYHAMNTKHKRRAQMNGQKVDLLVLLERHDGICGICGQDVDPMRFEVDHAIPLSRGGAHAYWNCGPAHPDCNNRKQDKMPWEMVS